MSCGNQKERKSVNKPSRPKTDGRKRGNNKPTTFKNDLTSDHSNNRRYRYIYIED